MNNLELIEETLNLKMGRLSDQGALVVETGKFTGRAVNERYVARYPQLEGEIDWGKANQPIEAAFADEFFTRLEKKLNAGKTYTSDNFIATFPIHVISTSPWHILFARNMFRSTPIEKLRGVVKSDVKIQIFHDPYGKVSDLGLKHSSETIIVFDPLHARVGIVGTSYAGEMKKSAFSMCNYLLPKFGIFPMHSSANTMPNGDNSCVLFGLSGTGKTSLSADATRSIIGDDEIIWTDSGLSNLEGGCYAKLIDLTLEKEPEIYKAVSRFGAIQENVVMDEARTVDFADRTKAENTRGSYPVTFLENVFDQNREASHPKNIIFLTCDAFGALPAVAKLDAAQAQFHFISGYTAKVAGTELGVKEPSATFSACFGAPFMPRPATVYAKMLAEKMEKHGSHVWILNTGWFGGAYGVGKRFPISVSKLLLHKIQSGELAYAPMKKHPIFGFQVPTSCEGVDSKFLAIPEGPQVHDLAEKFIKNFERFSKNVDGKVLSQGGPAAHA